MKVSNKIVELINEVKKHPTVWNKAGRNKDSYRMDTWTVICQNLIPAFNRMQPIERQRRCKTLQMCWKNIKDNYRRYRKRLQKSAVNMDKPPSFIYFGYLQFLDKTYGEKKAENPLDKNDEESDDNSMHEMYKYLKNYYAELSSDDSSGDDDDLDAQGRRMPKIRNAKRGDSTEMYMVELLRANIKKSTDEDVLFLNSLLPTMDKLNPDLKIRFRSQLMTIMMKILKGDQYVYMPVINALPPKVVGVKPKKTKE